MNNMFAFLLSVASVDHRAGDMPVETALQSGASGGEGCKRNKGKQQRRQGKGQR